MQTSKVLFFLLFLSLVAFDVPVLSIFPCWVLQHVLESTIVLVPCSNQLCVLMSFAQKA